MKKQKNSSAWMALPLYIFTIVFVICPLLYVVALSFATPNRGYGVTWKFTLDNYKNILEPVYLNTFVESLKLALTSTAGDRVDRLSIRILYGETSGTQEKESTSASDASFLGEFPDTSLWMDHYSSEKGTAEFRSYETGADKKAVGYFIQLSCYCGGNDLCIAAFYDHVCIFQRRKAGLVLCGGARDLGASRVQAFFTVTLKLTLPGLLSGVILTFVPSMGLFFIADILGGNKIVLVGSLIQDQMTRGSNWPFAAALAVVMMVLTTVMIMIYRKVSNARELEGIG